MTTFSFSEYLSTGFNTVNTDESGRTAMMQLYSHNFSKYLPKDTAAKMLDVGCGMGQCVEWLQQAGYTGASGVELSEEAVHFCKQRGLPVEHTSNTTEWLQTQVGKYDVIFSNDVIEHVPLEEVVAFTKAMYAALAPGGILIMKTNNVSALTGARMRYWDITHTTSYTEFSLQQLFHYAGVGDADMYPFTFAVRSPQRFVRWAVRSVVHAVWKLVYWSEYTLVPKIVHEYFFAVIKK